MVSTACPTFFRGAIREAQHCREGYARAGYHLAVHARALADEQDVETLDVLLASSAPEAEVYEWLSSALPRCMQLVPQRRRATFEKGIAQAIEEGRI